ncbi:MAG TPA: pyrimidine-nucleoside phosphorylase, partial [Anaerolineaceae bacterium]|nr:pyrimidine-nucleoside phosphorylase [Anaerolineaceae bacterium]
ETLHGKGPADFREHCFTVSAHMLLLGEKAQTLDEAYAMAEKAIVDGKAWDKFVQLVKAQNGDLSFIEHPEKLPCGSIREEIKAENDGFLAMVNAQSVGEAAVLLGAGREKKGDPIDLGVGITVHYKVGTLVKKGDVLFTIYANDRERLQVAKLKLKESVNITDEECAELPLFYGVV